MPHSMDITQPASGHTWPQPRSLLAQLGAGHLLGGEGTHWRGSSTESLSHVIPSAVTALRGPWELLPQALARPLCLSDQQHLRPASGLPQGRAQPIKALAWGLGSQELGLQCWEVRWHYSFVPGFVVRRSRM